VEQVIQSDIFYQDHTDVITHRTTQPSEGIILDRNKELRNNPGVIKDLGANGKGESWGRQVASIPEIIYSAAIRNGFDLNSQDSDHAGKEMNRFLQTATGRSCLVQGNH